MINNFLFEDQLEAEMASIPVNSVIASERTEGEANQDDIQQNGGVAEMSSNHGQLRSMMNAGKLSVVYTFQHKTLFFVSMAFRLSSLLLNMYQKRYICINLLILTLPQST